MMMIMKWKFLQIRRSIDGSSLAICNFAGLILFGGAVATFIARLVESEILVCSRLMLTMNSLSIHRCCRSRLR